jgi:hypothetical protein
MYVLWSIDIKNQEAVYWENVNQGDVLQSMPLYYIILVCVCVYMHLSIYVRHTVNILYIILMHFSYLLTISAG